MTLQQISALTRLFERYPALEGCRDDVINAADALIACFHNGGKLLLCGNGGSAADCFHIAGELLKGFNSTRPLSDEDRQAVLSLYGEQGSLLAEGLQCGLPAIALPAEFALATAMANDVHPSLVFAQGVLAYGVPGDILFCLSTSGKAANVIAAARTAKWRGLTVIGLIGKSGGELAPLCDIGIIAPGATTAEVQEYHLPIYHALCDAVENVLFPCRSGK